MRYLLFLIAVYISVNLYGQDNITVEHINNLYAETIQDTSKYEKKVFVDTKIGITETTKIYFINNQVKYIYYHRCIGGLTSVDDHFYKELFYIEGKLVFIRTLLKWDHFDKGFTPESKTEVVESLAYLDFNGECLKCYEERKATGTRITVMNELEKVSLKEEDCMYCGGDADEGAKYLKKLEK